MVKPNQDPKPAGPVRRAARTVARELNIRAAGRKVDEIFAEELDTPPDNNQLRAELRAALPRFAGLADAVTAHMAGLAAAILAATAAAALAGVLDAGLDKVILSPVAAAPTVEAEASVPSVRPTCDEPIAGCPQRGDAAGGRWSR
ncbi:hypothetical protein [Amycolatopsis sp. cmx-4-68]|uniref:hypothetical protein n=1 Tax=Amycolatopsis sp. cmx-4-68 TaxID=2790938 RepID=UPI0039793DA4